MGYVYILETKNNTFYIGSTRDLNDRLNRHMAGRSIYTRKLMPLKLVFSQKFIDYKQALSAEKWLKKQKDKDLIEKIIKNGKLNKIFGVVA